MITNKLSWSLAAARSTDACRNTNLGSTECPVPPRLLSGHPLTAFRAGILYSASHRLANFSAPLRSHSTINAPRKKTSAEPLSYRTTKGRGPLTDRIHRINTGYPSDKSGSRISTNLSAASYRIKMLPFRSHKKSTDGGRTRPPTRPIDEHLKQNIRHSEPGARYGLLGHLGSSRTESGTVELKPAAIHHPSIHPTARVRRPVRKIRFAPYVSQRFQSQ